MNQELKQQAHKEFDERFSCIQTSCDNNGTIANRISDDEWEPEPCQYCHEQRLPYKAFIDALIDKTVQMTEERIVEIIEEKSYMNDFGQTVIDDIDNLIKQIKNYE